MDPELIQLHQALISDVANINVQYLGIAVTILLVLGGAHYLLNVSPLRRKMERQKEKVEKAQEQIDRQSKDIRNAEKELQSLSEKLRKKIDSANKRVEEAIIEARLDSYSSIFANSIISDHPGMAALNAMKAIIIASSSNHDKLSTFLDRLARALGVMKEKEETFTENEISTLAGILDNIDTNNDKEVESNLENCKALLAQITTKD